MFIRSFASARVMRGTLLVALALSLGIGAGCSKPAQSLASDSNSVASVRGASTPEILGRFPSGPRFIAYTPSLSEIISKWSSQVATEPVHPDVAARVKTLLTQTSFGQALSAVHGEFALGVYDDDGSPIWIGFVESDSVEQLDDALEACVDSPRKSDVTVGVHSLTESGLGQESIFHGAVPGGWVFGTDRATIEQVLGGGKKNVPTDVADAWNTACSSTPPRLFASVLIGEAFVEPKAKLQAEMLGLNGIDRVSLALFEDSTRQQDMLFVHTKAPHRGIVSLLAGKPLTRSAVSDVPASTTAFTALSIDLAGFWAHLREHLPEQFATQLKMVEQGLKVDVGEDLLASLGHQLTWTELTDSSKENPDLLLSLLLADRKRLQETLGKLQPILPVSLEFRPGPNGADFLSFSEQPGVTGVMMTDRALHVCTSRDVLEKCASGGLERAAVASVERMFDRYGGHATVVSWVSAPSLTNSAKSNSIELDETFQWPPARWFTSLSEAFPVESLVPAFGDIGFAVVPSDHGLRIVVESDCGVLPILALLAVIGAEQHQQRLAEDRIGSIAATVRAAQGRYIESYGRFAKSLWELERARMIEPRIASGIDGHLLYRVVTSESDWQIDVRHETADLRYSVRSNGTVQTTQ